MSMKRSFEGFSGVQGGFRTFATASQVVWCENDRFCTIVFLNEWILCEICCGLTS